MNDKTEVKNDCDLKIILTDSGLGGLTVQALINKKLANLDTHPHIEIIFFNSLADKNLGYNSMDSIQEKVRIFESALKKMEVIDPKMIFIACNTLSAIFPETYLYKKSRANIFGIIEVGVNLILDEVSKEPGSIILFGTETTIKSERHKSALINRGLKEELITTQICSSLESAIQRGPESLEVERMIKKYVHSAANKLSSKSKMIFAAFCCTHYTYSREIFYRYLQKIFKDNFRILDPNEKMADLAVENILSISSEEGPIKNKVISKVRITENEKKLIGHQLHKISPNLCDALQKYKLNENLF